MIGVNLGRGLIGIPSPHAAHSGSHAPDSKWPSVGQFLHDVMPADIEF